MACVRSDFGLLIPKRNNPVPHLGDMLISGRRESWRQGRSPHSISLSMISEAIAVMLHPNRDEGAATLQIKDDRLGGDLVQIAPELVPLIPTMPSWHRISVGWP
jgi:hypothetical protein